MAYSEDQKTMIKQLMELCFDGLEIILESAKAKVCMPPNQDSKDCRHLLSFKTQLPTLKKEVIEKLINDPPPPPGGATAQLPLYKPLIEQLLTECIKFRHSQAFKEMGASVRQDMPQDTTTGGGSAQ